MKFQLVFDEKPRGTGGIGATQAIARLLLQQGMDAPASLYDEALELAKKGDYNAASERLRMLLCLDPTDGPGSLLLAKTLAARKQWQEAQSFLEIASQNGEHITPNIQRLIENGLKHQRSLAEQERAQILQRDRAEIDTLRQEIKKLRSGNSSLNSEIAILSSEIRSWSKLCAIVAGASTAILLLLLISGDPEDKEEPPEVQTTTDQEPATEEPPPIEDAPSEQPAEQAQEAPPEEPPPEPPPAPKSPYPIQHKVKPGETLSKIAQKYYRRAALWEYIAKHNNIKPEKLQIGQTLEIPEPPK